MKIGIIGSGQVGQTLAKGLSDEGHDVRIGSREGSKLQAFTAQTGIKEARFAEVASFADVIVLAVKGDVAEGLVRVNSVGAGLMVHPKVQGGTPSMFLCGNNADAKAQAAALAKQLGWNIEDVGTAAAGHAVEALCQIWCAPGFVSNDWMHAFAVLRP